MPSIVGQVLCFSLSISQPAALVLDRRKGKRVFFVTNNSTKSRAQYAKKLHGLGIEAT
jgi:ribonucleotide monophosphatase NagD (HAD superfamily)